VNIAHRDLKTANVLVGVQNGKHVAKIADFGLSKRKDTDKNGTTLMANTANVGTPLYMAPELMSNDTAAWYNGMLVDMYAFGIFMWAVLTGTKPYARLVTRRQLNSWTLRDLVMNGTRPATDEPYENHNAKKLSGIPARAILLMEQCWQGDPDERPSNFGEVVKALDALLQKISDAADPGTAAPRTAPAPVPAPAPTPAPTLLSARADAFPVAQIAAQIDGWQRRGRFSSEALSVGPKINKALGGKESPKFDEQKPLQQALKKASVRFSSAQVTQQLQVNAARKTIGHEHRMSQQVDRRMTGGLHTNQKSPRTHSGPQMAAALEAFQEDDEEDDENFIALGVGTALQELEDSKFEVHNPMTARQSQIGRLKRTASFV
jgi:serine/threonine protein kinase